MSERRAEDGLISVTVSDGKYTIQQTEPGKWEALRYGEEWPAFRDSGPDNLHVALAYEVSALRAERDHYKKIAEEGVGPIIKSMRLEDGSFDMAITGPIVEAMATAYVGQFKAGGSVNYMEMSFFDRDVQKVGAKSPADLVNEARAETSALKGEATFLIERLDDINLDDDTDDLIRDWNGHVEPSIARLRQLVRVPA